MNDSKSYELRPVDSMNNSGLRMIQAILGREPIALNVLNS